MCAHLRRSSYGAVQKLWRLASKQETLALNLLIATELSCCSLELSLFKDSAKYFVLSAQREFHSWLGSCDSRHFIRFGMFGEVERRRVSILTQYLESDRGVGNRD